MALAAAAIGTISRLSRSFERLKFDLVAIADGRRVKILQNATRYLTEIFEKNFELFNLIYFRT